MPWGVVAGAAIGAASDQAQGSANRKAAKKNNWVRPHQQDLISRATTIADRQYTPYTGTRVADLAPNERTAINLASDATTFNDARNYLDRAGQTIDGVSDWSTETMKKYMDPYVDQVVDSTLRRENEAYQGRLADLRSSQAVRGAFGSDRATLAESEETGRHLDTVGDLTAQGYSNAYRTALDAWSTDNQTKLATADALRAVGGDVSRLNSAQITDLLRTGGADRLLRQMELDVDYQDFIEQRDWDANNLEPLFRAVEGAAGNQGQPIPADTTASSLLGMASTLVGYFGSRDSGVSKGSTGGTGAGMGTATPVSGYQGIGMGDYWGGGNSGSMDA